MSLTGQQGPLLELVVAWDWFKVLTNHFRWYRWQVTTFVPMNRIVAGEPLESARRRQGVTENVDHG